MEQLHDEEEIADDSNNTPYDADYERIARRIHAHPFPQDEPRDCNTQWHHIPSDQGRRHQREEHEAEHISDKPEEASERDDFLHTA